MSLIQDAQSFAEIAHAGQTRKGAGREPYVIHLQEVADLVRQFGGSEEAIIAAWLHDTVEDCDVTFADLDARFGTNVSKIVAELTDDKTLPKPERKRLQIVNAPGKSPEAALVKLCDKMSNVRAVGAMPPVHWTHERRHAYIDWAETVVRALPLVSDAARKAFDQVARDARAALAQG